ncbi:MAG TPA: hypothetical protein VEK80_12680 [Kribbellaceae bacterium]|nr:hypothetical protein [Kribbellaceae bacterium]
MKRSGLSTAGLRSLASEQSVGAVDQRSGLPDGGLGLLGADVHHPVVGAVLDVEQPAQGAGQRFAVLAGLGNQLDGLAVVLAS